MKLLRYTSEGSKCKLEEISLDVNMNPVFLSAIEMLDDENYIGADGRHVFTCQKNRCEVLTPLVLKPLEDHPLIRFKLA